MNDALKSVLEALMNYANQQFGAEIATQLQTEAQRIVSELPPPQAAPPTPPQAAPQPAMGQPAPQGVSPVQFSELETTVKTLQSENRSLRFENYFATLLTTGKVTPAQRGYFETLYNNQSNMSFAEGQGTTAEEFINKYLETLPKIVEFGEFTNKEQAPKGEPLADIQTIVENHYKGNK